MAKSIYSFLWSHASPSYAWMYDIDGNEIDWENEDLENLMVHPNAEFLSMRDVAGKDDYEIDVLLKKMWIERGTHIGSKYKEHFRGHIQAVREFLTDTRRFMESINYLLCGEKAQGAIRKWIEEKRMYG